MIQSFPTLKKHPYLLPFYWCRMNLQRLFSQQSRARLRAILHIKKEHVKNAVEWHNVKGVLSTSEKKDDQIQS